MWQLSTAFHETLCRAAGNGCLLRTLNGLKELVMRLRFLSLRKTRIRAWDQHDLMIGYIEKQDKEALAGLMRAPCRARRRGMRSRPWRTAPGKKDV